MSRRRQREAAAAGGGGPTSVNPPTIGEMNQFTKYYRNMLFDYSPDRKKAFIKILIHKGIPTMAYYQEITPYIENNISKFRREYEEEGRAEESLNARIFTVPVKLEDSNDWIIAVNYNMEWVDEQFTEIKFTLLTNRLEKHDFQYFFMNNEDFEEDFKMGANIKKDIITITKKRERKPLLPDLLIDYFINNIPELYNVITNFSLALLGHQIRNKRINDIVKKINTQSVSNCDRQDRRITELEEVNRTLEGTNEVLRNEATTLRERLVRAEEGRRLAEYNLGQRDTIREQNPGEQITATDETYETEDMVTEGGRRKNHKRRNKRKTRRNKRKTRRNKLAKK
jgi:hypothetical protein